MTITSTRSAETHISALPVLIQSQEKQFASAANKPLGWHLDSWAAWSD